jgi:hypothetical protein
MRQSTKDFIKVAAIFGIGIPAGCAIIAWLLS